MKSDLQIYYESLLQAIGYMLVVSLIAFIISTILKISKIEEVEEVEEEYVRPECLMTQMPKDNYYCPPYPHKH